MKSLNYPASIFGSKFLSNQAKRDGGAVYIGQGNGFGITKEITIQAIRIDGCEFTTNTAYGNGGMMYVSVLNAIVMDSPLAFRNMAYKDGGAIFLYSLNYVSIARGTFTENVALVNGGAVASLDSNWVWFYTAVDFMRNSAGLAGGAVHEQLNSMFLYWNGTANFVGNLANTEGGAIAVLNNAFLSIRSDTLFQGTNLHLPVSSSHISCMHAPPKGWSLSPLVLLEAPSCCFVRVTYLIPHSLLFYLISCPSRSS